MIKKIFSNAPLWGLVLFFCLLSLIADYIGFIEPFSELWVNVIRVALVLSFIVILGNAVRN